MVELGQVANAVGNLLIAALGAAVVLLAPRRPANVALAGFAVGFGASSIIATFVAPAWGVVAAALLRVVAAGALVAMALCFPTSLEHRERKLLVLPAAFLVAAAAATAIGLPRYPGDAPALLRFLSAALLSKLLLAVAILLAARAMASKDPTAQKLFALPSAALLIVPVIVSSPASSTPYEATADRVLLVVTVALAFAWLVAGTRGVEPRLARNAAWWALGLVVAGALIGAPSVRGFGVSGLMMLATVGLLAYAILRHQLLGIDVKLRWTISKSTIAAAFVAAFFLASEGAQLVFGAENEWVGLVGAGALVFALAPLQRAAERLAERAVPTGSAPPPLPVGPSRGAEEDTYRVAVRKFLADGRITREEERHLARVAARLGLDVERATEIRHEVEDANDPARKEAPS